MAEKLTHWKKLNNPDYLGAYALDPGKDMVLTIKSVVNETITGADGKKEECMVMRFTENVKPLVLNSTNAKTIESLLKTPYIEKWTGSRIQLYVDRVRAFGEIVDAIRIRNYLPKVQTNKAQACQECGQVVTATEKMNAAQVAVFSQTRFGKILCPGCLKEVMEKAAQDAADKDAANETK